MEHWPRAAAAPAPPEEREAGAGGTAFAARRPASWGGTVFTEAG